MLAPALTSGRARPYPRFVEPKPVIKKSPKKKAKAPPAKKTKSPKKEKAAKPAKKEKKDPNAPKRGLSAFMFFGNDMREKIKADNPGCSFGEVGKFLGEAWSKVDAATKSKYEKKAADDKVRYEKAKAAYEKKE
jgi:structure-specific recognition protein 1